MKLKVKRLHKDAKLPQRAHLNDSGLDLFSVEDVYIGSGEMKPVNTGIAIQLPKPTEINVFPTELGIDFRQTLVWEGQVRPKSGLALNQQITVLNTPGTIDNTYRGQIIVLLQNHSNIPVYIKKNQKIAQLVIVPIIIPEVIEVDELDDTERNDNGFGSTGL